jgi:hypothetical protein
MTTLFNKVHASLPESIRMSIAASAIMAEESICDCSSCAEAMDAALAEGTKLLEHQCPAYVIQVALSMLELAKWATIAYAHQQAPAGVDIKDVVAVALERHIETMKEYKSFLAGSVEKLSDTAEAALAKAAQTQN